MNKKLLILFCVFSIAVADHSFAAVRFSNQSRAYSQMAAMQQQAEYYNEQQTNTVDTLPVRVANRDLADKIIRGDSSAGVDVGVLESCATIYPGGNFAWDRPTAGLKLGSQSTCVAVVELRVVNGVDDIIVARAKVAAGDSIDCNISSFPEADYTPDAYNVTFPADREPTHEDVIKVMNDEQKKNAGFKIAAGTIIGGIVGNVAGKNEIGKSSLLGTGKSKMQGTVIGALSGGTLAAGSSYAGKVGGDIILSAGVNAAAGGAIGNMVASGDSVLRIEDCMVGEKNTKCLWGVVEKYTTLSSDETDNKPVEIAFYNISNGRTMVCDKDRKKCRTDTIGKMSFDGYESLEKAVADNNFSRLMNRYTYNSETQSMEEGYFGDPEGAWAMAKTAGRPAQRVAAMIPDFQDKAFGMKMNDWHKWRSENLKSTNIVGRSNRGEEMKLSPSSDNVEWTVEDFSPLLLSADDGGIVDVSNKARLSGTLVGAGAGAGLGAFTAYQGAQDEIDARWVSAVTEYKDSLQKVYCATGTRYLSGYNSVAVIPNMQ